MKSYNFIELVGAKKNYTFLANSRNEAINMFLEKMGNPSFILGEKAKGNANVITIGSSHKREFFID